MIRVTNMNDGVGVDIFTSASNDEKDVKLSLYWSSKGKDYYTILELYPHQVRELINELNIILNNIGAN